MRKIITLVASLALLVTLTACNDSKSPLKASERPVDSTTASTLTYETPTPDNTSQGDSDPYANSDIDPIFADKLRDYAQSYGVSYDQFTDEQLVAGAHGVCIDFAGGNDYYDELAQTRKLGMTQDASDFFIGFSTGAYCREFSYKLAGH